MTTQTSTKTTSTSIIWNGKRLWNSFRKRTRVLPICILGSNFQCPRAVLFELPYAMRSRRYSMSTTCLKILLSSNATRLFPLQRRAETLLHTAIQSQEVCYLTQVINSPEPLSFPLGISTFKPRNAKRTSLERPASVGTQKALNFRLAHLR